MKTLVLSDESFRDLAASSPKAKALLLSHSEEDLPDAETLHELARSKETPAIFGALRARMDALEDASTDVRSQMHELIRGAHRRGVGVTTLARWSDYSLAHLYVIIEGRPE